LKVGFAEFYKASAVLLFSDPENVAPNNTQYVYPQGEFLPNTGVQRGSVALIDGDPLTPNYPSTGYFSTIIFLIH
jgi:hypothetical protein